MPGRPLLVANFRARIALGAMIQELIMNYRGKHAKHAAVEGESSSLSLTRNVFDGGSAEGSQREVHTACVLAQVS